MIHSSQATHAAMSLNVIELNDAAVQVTRDGSVVCRSPGVALLESHQILAGNAAQARAYLKDRKSVV